MSWGLLAVALVVLLAPSVPYYLATKAIQQEAREVQRDRAIVTAAIDQAVRTNTFAVLPLLVLTTRNETNATQPSLRYGTDPAHATAAVANITVPREHRLGSVETPSIWRFQFDEDPTAHVIVRDLAGIPKEQLIGNITSARHKGLGVFVYVPGWNVGFGDSVRQAAVVSYDLAFSGKTVLYSWPSKGLVTSYIADEANADSSAAALADLLAKTTTGNGPLHIVASDMGARVVFNALRGMPRPVNQSIANLVLIAPDIDEAVFRQAAAQLAAHVDRITIYISRDNRALQAARLVHGRPRLGSLEATPTFSEPNIDVVVGLNGTSSSHSYFRSSSGIMADIFQLLNGKEPAQRFGLRRVGSGWVLEP